MRNRIYALACLFGCCFLSFAPCGLLAQAPRLNTTKVLIFENNTAFILREGKVRFQGRKLALADIPQALYGTLWAHHKGSGYNISRVSFGIDTVLVEAEAHSLFELLKANVGNKAAVSYRTNNDPETALGEILPFPTGTELVSILQANRGTVFIRKEALSHAEIMGVPKIRYTDRVVMPATTIEVDKTPELPVPLQLMYFTQGITWKPGYQVKLKGDTTAVLNITALVDNRAEDIHNAEVFLIRGRPTLKANGKLDPAVLQALTQAGVETASVATPTATESGAAATFETPDTSAPEGLLIYPVGRISLAKGSKSYVAAFRQNISSKRTNSCHIPLLFTDISNPQPSETYLGEAYESIRFQNVSGGALLPGPIFVVNDQDSPLGQDDLPYTPMNGEVLIRTSRIGSAEITVTEANVARKDNAKQENKIPYTRFTLKGSIKVRNKENFPLTLVVSKDFVGDVPRLGNAEMVRNGRKVGINPEVRATWRINVAPGGTATLPFEYGVFAPGR